MIGYYFHEYAKRTAKMWKRKNCEKYFPVAGRIYKKVGAILQ